MLDRTARKIQSFYAEELQRGSDGQLHEVDKVTRIDFAQCEYLAELHHHIRPDLSIETGLAYGFSTMCFLDAMTRHDYGRHIAIDPFQEEQWSGIGLQGIRDLGLSERFEHVSERSDRALPRLVAEGRRAQLMYLDAQHYLETVLRDFAFADRLLDQGGILIFNNIWLPVIRTVASYVTSNVEHYETWPQPHENTFIIRKIGEDRRRWDHFVPFNGAGTYSEPQVERKKSLFGRLLGGRS